MTTLRSIAARFRALVARGAASETGGAVLRRLAPSAILATILLPVTAVVCYALSGLNGNQGVPGEYPYFGPAGAALLDGHWNAVFASPIVQAGPFELLPYGVAKLLVIHSAVQWYFFYVVMLWLMTFLLSLVIFLPLARVSGRLGRYVPILVLGVSLIGAFTPTAVVRAHLAEVLVPLLWIVAGSLSRERMFAAAGVMIGLSAGFEVWGVLGAPVIFLATSPRFLRAAIGAVATLAIIYVPFVLTGVFRMFDFHWDVNLISLYRLLWPHLDSFPWTLRLAQALLALGAGVLVAFLTRRSIYGIWLVPMAILTVRLVFDPLLFFYYWMAPATVALCVLAVALYRRAWIPAVIAAGIVAWLWLPPADPLLTAILMSALVLGAAITVRLLERRARPNAEDSPAPSKPSTGSTPPVSTNPA